MHQNPFNLAEIPPRSPLEELTTLTGRHRPYSRLGGDALLPLRGFRLLDSLGPLKKSGLRLWCFCWSTLWKWCSYKEGAESEIFRKSDMSRKSEGSTESNRDRKKQKPTTWQQRRLTSNILYTIGYNNVQCEQNHTKTRLFRQSRVLLRRRDNLELALADLTDNFNNNAFIWF